MNFVEGFNCLTYNKQCEYIQNKLLSLDLYEIKYITFFKKLHVLYTDLPSHLNKISKDNKSYMYNFNGVLGNNDGYFCITRGFIHIKYKRLIDNIYSVKIPIRNAKMYLRTYIDINSI